MDPLMTQAFTFRPVTPETWPDFAQLFESRGGPKTCWCTAWRQVAPCPGAPRPAEAKKAEMARRVAEGQPIGLLAYLDAQPVAWCSIAPRASYRPTLSDVQPGDAEENIWSLVCFFIARPFRGQGLFAQMLAAAERHAAQNGATQIEAYPVDPDSPSYRFGGFVPAFEAAGFVPLGRKGERRHILRKPVKI